MQENTTQMKGTRKWVRLAGVPTESLALDYPAADGTIENPIKVVVLMDGKPVFRYAEEEGNGGNRKEGGWAARVLGPSSSETFSNVIARALEQANVKVAMAQRGVRIVLTELPVTSKAETGTVVERLAKLTRPRDDRVFIFGGVGVANAVFGQDAGKGFGRLRTIKIPVGKGKQRSIKAIVSLPVPDMVDPKPPVKGSEGGGTVGMLDVAVEHVSTAIAGRNRYDISIRLPAGVPKYTLVDTMAKFKAMMAAVRKSRTPIFDFEGDNLSRISNRLLTMQVCAPTSLDDDDPPCFVLPLRHDESPWTAKEYKIVCRHLRDYFEDGSLSDYTIWASARYDIGQIIAGFNVRWFDHDVYDVQTSEHLLNENRKFLPKVWFHATRPFSLQALEWHYGYVRSGLAIDKDDRKNMGEKSLKDLGDYGVIDVLSPFFIHKCQLAEAFRVRYKKFRLMAIDQCGSTSKVIARMENVGNLADLEYLQSQALPSSDLNKALAELEETFKSSPAVRKTNRLLTDEAGHVAEGLFGKAKRPFVFSIRKPEHRHKLFFEVLKLPPVQVSQKTNKPSTGKKFQDTYKLRVPEVAQLEEYTKQFKLRSAFVDSLLNRFMEDPDTAKDSHIRSSYSTLSVVTGRLSSFDVNLQNIPSRGKLAKIIKRIFIAAKGRVLLKCDYSAHEVRVLGIVSRDDAILALFQAAHEAKLALRLAKTPEELAAAVARFKREGDIHISNVRLMFNQEVDKDHPLRQSIKTAVFGTIYAMGPAALAAQLFTVHETEKNLIRFIKKNIEEQNILKAKIKKANDPDSIAALTAELGKKAADHRNLVEQLRRKRLTDDEKIQEASDLMNKLFSAWPTASAWMDKLKVTADKNLTVTSPIGRVRHLSGYLHSEKRAKSAMGRRTANSVIQGMASEQATMSGHITGKLLWDMFGPEGKMDHKLHNMVHDSQMWSCPIHLLPLMAYFVEHGMTTLMREHYQKKYKVDIPIPYGIDMEFGLNEAKMHGWNMRADTMLKIGDELLKESGASKKQIAAFRKNATLVSKIREFELRKYPNGGMSKKGKSPEYWEQNIAWAA